MTMSRRWRVAQATEGSGPSGAREKPTRRTLCSALSSSALRRSAARAVRRLAQGREQLPAVVQRERVQEDAQALAAEHRGDRVLRHAHAVVRHAALPRQACALAGPGLLHGHDPGPACHLDLRSSRLQRGASSSQRMARIGPPLCQAFVAHELMPCPATQQ